MARRRRPFVVAWSFLAMMVVVAPTVAAHAVADPYRLPVPLSFFLFGAGAALALSFLFFLWFLKKRDVRTAPAERPMAGPFRLARRPWIRAALAALSMLLFLVTVSAGLFGTSFSRENWAPTFFWIGFFLGFTYLVALIGDVWPLVNPWRILLDGLERLLRRPFRPLFAYPRWLGYGPAFAWLAALIWIELVSFTPGDPRLIGWLLVHYSWITVAGAFLFGKDAWLRHGEVFGVLFRLVGAVAPFRHTSAMTYLRRPVYGLLEFRAHHLSLLFLVLFLMAATAADGLFQTGIQTLVAQALQAPFARADEPSLREQRTTLILLTFAAFVVLYFLAIAVKQVLSDDAPSLRRLALAFAPTLVPIALAYHVAHYFALLVSEFPVLVGLASDPFGRGWDLFGTAPAPEEGVPPNAAVVWYLQVVILLVGHVAGIFLTHVVALRTFGSRLSSVASQVPMLVLMVLYTVMGLWSLAQSQTVPH